jgi:hypothetical protein
LLFFDKGCLGRLGFTDPVRFQCTKAINRLLPIQSRSNGRDRSFQAGPTTNERVGYIPTVEESYQRSPLFPPIGEDIYSKTLASTSSPFLFSGDSLRSLSAPPDPVFDPMTSPEREREYTPPANPVVEQSHKGETSWPQTLV